ncbi:PREDICTED: uncharacterized protein LOC104724882 isoform X1 [Camelina sativa]|uniref:Uncharacterized protein LOC104724882 isoform X1 n=1 Tax=Camelina sativa TaxID=90675 RepID=A0ABM0UIS0_CAMSA|nr:PREDICTED: uncharacterized protein LOC104724882 isoform X1 [Camelina sativa]
MGLGDLVIVVFFFTEEDPILWDTDLVLSYYFFASWKWDFQVEDFHFYGKEDILTIKECWFYGREIDSFLSIGFKCDYSITILLPHAKVMKTSPLYCSFTRGSASWFWLMQRQIDAISQTSSGGSQEGFVICSASVNGPTQGNIRENGEANPEAATEPPEMADVHQSHPTNVPHESHEPEEDEDAELVDSALF